ncbi:DNA-binding GntR family transcriptional regulator [Actinoplanes lutulentus]|uniref:GntR family transcriptional regulator n=1 Tax=Actinoplanes lutulentus TaxID=1287878 RepID=A0A327ZJP4_9ACTN|nr:GntR family transcriptional regulator [Actinoplanes lutulentus]MBB2940858.1 DNA-binding GntR family transcriptional regulator [Actinoplanes lutulentus]RAK43167.1 GntR family transcriptional regulator [Actinoplanes lutulentus]
MVIPSERPQLSEEVAATLRGRIMSGDLRPGARIRLEEVAAQLGVSITPVREALLTLRGEDMVELEPRKGYVVSPLSKQDVLDVFQLQGDIAAELAGRVAERITGPQLAEITLKNKALARAKRTDEIERLEFEFHRAINLIADARKLSWFLHTATRYTPARFYAADPGWRAGMVEDHEALLVAFGSADGAAARTVMTRHFTDGAQLLVKHLDDLGLWE